MTRSLYSMKPKDRYAALKFRAMTVDDLDSVEFIANQSFPSPWSMKTFKREIESNEQGRYWVLTAENPTNVLAQRSGGERAGVISYGGCWLMGNEAHIVTVATHPDWRQQGMGKLLLLLMIRALAREHW